MPGASDQPGVVRAAEAVAVEIRLFGPRARQTRAAEAFRAALQDAAPA